jgi:hypothetical protein
VGPTHGTGPRSHAAPESPVRIAIAVAVLGAVVGVVFARALRQPLLADDYSYLERVRTSGWWHARTVWGLKTSIFRPMLYMWFGVLNRLFGLHPLPFHIASGLLLVAAAVLVGLIARRLGLRSGAYAAAAVFCLHASMAIPIGWAAAANSPLATVVALSSILLLLRSGLRALDVVAACALFALALISREVVAVAPAILVITRFTIEVGEHWPARLKRAVLASSPLWIVVVAYSAARRAAGFSASKGAYAQRLSWHGLTNLGRLMEFSTDVAPLHHSTPYGAFVAVFWVAFVGVCALAALRFGRPQGLVGLAWALIGVLPVIFLAVQPMSSYYNDFALPGLALAAGTLFEWGVGALPARRAIAVAAVSLVAFAALGMHTANQEMNRTLSPWARVTHRLVAQAKCDNPHPANESAIVLREANRGFKFLSQHGNLYRVIFHEPTQVPLLVRDAAPNSAPHRPQPVCLAYSTRR